MAVDARIEPTIETVTPGERLGPNTYDVDGHTHPDFYDASATDEGWLRLPDGRVAIPHTVAFEDGNRTFSQKYLSGRKLNARIIHTFYRPVVAPDRLTATVAVERTYIRRGREHVEFLALVRDSEARLVLASRNNWVMNSSVRHEQDSPPEAFDSPPVLSLPPREFTLPVPTDVRALRPGDELPTLTRSAWLFEPPGGHGPNSVHGDEYARRVLGTRGAIVLGSTTLGYVNELLGRTLGPSWLERGSLDVRFTGAVVRNDPVTAHARVVGVERDAEGDRVDIEVWVTDGAMDDQKVISGIASYRL